MSFSRRSFFNGGVAAFLGADLAQAAPEAPQAVPLEVLALNRMAYGPRQGDVQRVKTMGLTAYVDEQLNPNPSTDTDCTNRIAAALLRINYAAGTGYPALDEMRPLEPLSSRLRICGREASTRPSLSECGQSMKCGPPHGCGRSTANGNSWK